MSDEFDYPESCFFRNFVSSPWFLPLSVKSLFSPFVSKQCPRSQINLSYVSKIQPAVIPSVWDTTKHSERAPMNYSFISHERISLCLSCFTLARENPLIPAFSLTTRTNKQHHMAVRFPTLQHIDQKEKKCISSMVLCYLHMCIMCGCKYSRTHFMHAV